MFNLLRKRLHPALLSRKEQNPMMEHEQRNIIVGAEEAGFLGGEPANGDRIGAWH